MEAGTTLCWHESIRIWALLGAWKWLQPRLPNNCCHTYMVRWPPHDMPSLTLLTWMYIIICQVTPLITKLLRCTKESQTSSFAFDVILEIKRPMLNSNKTVVVRRGHQARPHINPLHISYCYIHKAEPTNNLRHACVFVGVGGIQAQTTNYPLAQENSDLGFLVLHKSAFFLLRKWTKIGFPWPSPHHYFLRQKNLAEYSLWLKYFAL